MANIEFDLTPFVPPVDCPWVTWAPPSQTGGTVTWPITEASEPPGSFDYINRTSVASGVFRPCPEEWWVLNMDWSVPFGMATAAQTEAHATINRGFSGNRHAFYTWGFALGGGQINATYDLEYRLSQINLFGPTHTWTESWTTDFTLYQPDGTFTVLTHHHSVATDSQDFEVFVPFPAYTPASQYWVHRTATPITGGFDLLFASNFDIDRTVTYFGAFDYFEEGLAGSFLFSGDAGVTAAFSFTMSDMLPAATMWSGPGFTGP